MWPNPQFPVDLVTFAEEIPNVNNDFLCSVRVTNKVFTKQLIYNSLF